MDGELRARILSEFPNLQLPSESRTFFCSQLVSLLLDKNGLIGMTKARPDITPTGLSVVLSKSGTKWKDVTSEVYNEAAIDEISENSPASMAATYDNRMARVHQVRALIPLTAATEIIGGYMDRMNKSIEDTMDKLLRMK